MALASVAVHLTGLTSSTKRRQGAAAASAEKRHTKSITAPHWSRPLHHPQPSQRTLSRGQPQWPRRTGTRISYSAVCEIAVLLAEKLGSIAPGNLSKVLFTTGGSDAVELAVKLARAATGRFKTLSFWDAFHGAGIGASALSGEALFRSGPAAPVVAGAQHVAPFACYRCPYGHPVEADGRPYLDQCRMACAGMVDYVLSRETDVAAVIAEPARAVPFLPPPGYWRQVREACDRHGALLIFDEIPTGLGKTGRMFACDHDGVVPDLLVMGKALGGGIVPIAAVMARPELDVAAQ